MNKKSEKHVWEESKLGRRIRREIVSHHYRFYPEGRLNLLLHSMPKTLIENSLSGLKIREWNLEQPQILERSEGGIWEKSEPERESPEFFLKTLPKSLNHICIRQMPIPHLRTKGMNKDVSCYSEKKCLEFKFG